MKGVFCDGNERVTRHQRDVDRFLVARMGDTVCQSEGASFCANQSSVISLSSKNRTSRSRQPRTRILVFWVDGVDC